MMRLIKTILIFSAALLLISACREKSSNLNNAQDIKLIMDNLGAPGASIESERIAIDNYRNYYCVFFNAKNINQKHLTTTLKKYSDDSSEKNNLYLHRVSYKNLKNISWGPIDKYENMNQVVGIWNKDYLVYISFDDDNAHGYFENLYSSEPGSGPFR